MLQDLEEYKIEIFSRSTSANSVFGNIMGSDTVLKVNSQLSLKRYLFFLMHLLVTLEHRPSYSCRPHGQSRAIFAWQL